MQHVSLESGIRHSEEFVKALGIRYGFRERDYHMMWDGGEFEPSRSVHELMIAIDDGRRFATYIDHSALMHQDAWKYLRQIDDAFMTLGRRTTTRGI
jgi:hypothetical protein